jgi:hypothetical protein
MFSDSISVLARFFPVLAWFFSFGSIFSVWLGFPRFGSVLARFGSVFFWFFVGFGSARFFAYKTETEPAGFLKI